MKYRVWEFPSTIFWPNNPITVCDVCRKNYGIQKRPHYRVTIGETSTEYGPYLVSVCSEECANFFILKEMS